MRGGWIGVDLDGTLAEWDGEEASVCTVGKPIPRMVERVRNLLALGYTVRIFTARVGPASDEECIHALKLAGITAGPLPARDWHNFQLSIIEPWCREHIGRVLDVTCVKDFKMIELYDDRCKQVATNQGYLLEEVVKELQAP